MQVLSKYTYSVLRLHLENGSSYEVLYSKQKDAVPTKTYFAMLILGTF